MYINYEKIGRILGFGQEFFYNLKIASNCAYIKNNIKKVKQRLKHKKQLAVAFYVYDDSKWKCQSIYDLMEKDERFTPYIFVTKNNAPKDNFNYQDAEDVLKVYNFFKTRNMRVKNAYDIKNQKFIPFEDMTPKPDIIIYQHPWYVETTQGPVVCSKFALTYYVPYFISDIDNSIECDLRFHRYIYRYYVPDEDTMQSYALKMQDKGKKLIVAGHPQLDNYLKKDFEQERKYVIYAPHWTVCGNNLRYSTFDWNGFKILEFAEKHKELNWVFKPHPCLYNFLFMSGYMSKEQADEYYQRWSNIGIVHNEGDYIKLFQQSNTLITDSGSFLIEYFFTKQPCIHLVSDSFAGNQNARDICSTYYNVYNLEEMYRIFEEILINKQDTKKQDRLNLLKKMDYPYSAEIIINDLGKNL